MNKSIIIFILLLDLTTSQTYSTTQCKCEQLLSQADCIKNQQFGCSWDGTKEACAVSTSTVLYATYCDQFPEIDCPKAKPCEDCGSYAACAWVNKTCQFFTGCTAFAKTLDFECQAISNRCITDGTHCVEIDDCSTYKKKLPCMKNATGGLCYWDTTNNVCSDANTCDKLPKWFVKDKSCRDMILTCTTKAGGGCVESGDNCSDQKLEIQCLWNKFKSTECYWDGLNCKDRICDNAPESITTDDTCKYFTIDGSCTTKANGGCVTRTTCAAATIQAACIKNNTGGDCFWTGIACVDKTCTNAPTTLTTNLACGGFLKGCITKSGGGCVANGACSAANVSAACQKNSSGFDCIWDTTCKEYICQNAPTIYDTHELCSQYLPTCTIQIGGGCQNRTCENAPTTLTTNDECEAYLPGSNCITRIEGGCVKNTTCSNITLPAACIQNASGVACIFDEKSSRCKDKNCLDAPSSINTHELCVSFLSTCTVNSTKTGCVEQTCENSQAQAICYKDLNNKDCIWKGKCYKKECVQALSSTVTHADCQQFDKSCTLSNSGSGCVPIPLRCEVITIESACNIRLQITNGVKSYPECGWNGSSCIDRACSTAPKTISTTSDCNRYKSGCVANNPVNGTISGCQDLPEPCPTRKSIENCEITYYYYPICLWNTSTSTCVEKSCATANQTGTKGVLTAGQFTIYGCRGYLYGCISNNNQDGCIAKPLSCSGLVQHNCGIQSKANGDCYWNGSSCVDRTCTNFLFTTHFNCQNQLNICTTNNSRTACQNLSLFCASYLSSENCKITSDLKNCIWTGSLCRNATCSDASNSFAFDTDEKCSAYQTPSEICTVVYKTKGLGCVTRSSNCSDYVSQAQCYRTLTATSNDCTWKASYNKCFSNTYLKGECTTFKGTKTQCESITVGCTNTVDAVETSACTFSCSAITGLTGATHAICQAFNTSCTANAAAVACINIEAVCSSYITSNVCTTKVGNLKCFWNGTACLDITSENCYAVTGLTGADHVKCQKYNNSCTNDGTIACRTLEADCSSYKSLAKCTIKVGDLACFWNGSVCLDITSTNCNSVTGLSNANHATCQAYSASCTINAAGDACRVLQAACISYLTQHDCKERADGLDCFWKTADGGNPAACLDITSENCNQVTGLTDASHATCQAYNISCTNDGSTACRLQTCELVASPSWANCQAFSKSCSLKRDGSACVPIQPQCSGYIIIANCYRSIAGFCISNKSDNSCVSLTPSTICEALYLGAGNYTHERCNEFNNTCTNFSTTGCQIKTCANFIGAFNHSACNAWLSTCTANLASSPTMCTTMPDTCTTQTQAACVWAVEGECVVQGASCVKKTCDTAPSNNTFDTHSKCIGYLSTCTVAREGGCQARAACTTYRSSQQCKFNSSGGKCFWNPTIKICVDLNCSYIEVTTLYDTHAKCVAVDSSLLCTVRAIEGAAVPGCMARGACNTYQIEDQCKKNASGGVCVWNTNSAQPVCQDKSCTSAPTAVVTDNECYAYFYSTTIKCTVVAIIEPNSGEIVLGGCQQRADCSTYIHQEQCKFNANGDACGWNGSKCADKSCATAPATADYDNNDKCRAYFKNKCIVASTGQGCVEIPDTCETMVEKQCISDRSGRLCYWDGMSCITRSCENAPDATTNAEECNTYLAGCTLDSVKCKTKVCEDYVFSTDDLCKQALSTCTTNGTNCVTRSTCFQAQNQAGCVTSAMNEPCEWIPSYFSFKSYCTIKTCKTAPFNLKSEADCANYFSNCTTTKGGGCVSKSTCSAVTIEAACITDIDGTICAWDSEQNNCRVKDCQDFIGITHAACQAQRPECTAGAKGKCARVQICEKTTIRSACIEGINGPCLWIDDFVNTDGSKGACFTYTSCKSLPWNTDAQCKLISNQCTTNGSNCVGITLCSETNIDGGCVTGYDGPCIQSVPALNSSDPKVCKPFTSCTDAFYTTHLDCQMASHKCTTNGINGCIALDACSSYTSQEVCKLNEKGVVYKSGAIVSTGICIWDTTTNSCRDQTCADFSGTTNAACSQQLSICTSDGTACLLKEMCSSYTTKTACTTAVGSDGACYWELESANCRLFTCANISNGTASNVCSLALSSCVSNGTTCIPKANCSTYRKKIACNSGGLDGICVFTQSTATGATVGTGTCQLMTACITADNDEAACQAARDRCSWTQASGTGTATVASKCSPHTCATNQTTNRDCTRFFNWDKKSQQICILVRGICIATDPSTLLQSECFLASGYTYTWNISTSKCEVCTKDTVQPNNTDNNKTNQSIEKPTAYGYILGLSTVILGYFIF